VAVVRAHRRQRGERSAGSASSRVFFSACTSTEIQRGCSWRRFRIEVFAGGSNWVASGYGALATRAMPATPGSAQLEW
jgi:hypothetical protein